MFPTPIVTPPEIDPRVEKIVVRAIADVLVVGIFSSLVVWAFSTTWPQAVVISYAYHLLRSAVVRIWRKEGED